MTDKKVQLIFRIMDEKLKKYHTHYMSYNQTHEELFKGGWKQYKLIKDAIDYLHEKLDV
jgi:hypothetical protein